MNRRILLTLLAAIFVALLGVGIIVPIMPLYAESLGATSTMIGLMVAGFSISRGVLQPIVGGMSDRHGRRRFMAIGLLIYSLAGLLYVIAGSVLDLILIRIGHGVGSAMIVPIAMSYIGDLSPEGEEGRYMGMFNIALFSGIGAGPVIGGFFLDNFGSDWAFYAMSSMAALSLALVLFVLPADTGNSDDEHVRLLDTFKRMAHNPRVLGILLSRISTMIVMVPSMAFLPLLMEEFMEASGAQIGMVIATRTLTNAALQTPFGKMADRRDRVGLLMVGSAIMAASMFAIPQAGSFGLLLVVFAVMGSGEAIVWPTLAALATEEGRRYGQGSMMGVFNMAMSAGIFAGSIGAGTVADTFGLRWAFSAVGILLVVSTVVTVKLMRTEFEEGDVPAGVPVEAQAVETEAHARPSETSRLD